jgi:polyferredoxin
MTKIMELKDNDKRQNIRLIERLLYLKYLLYLLILIFKIKKKINDIFNIQNICSLFRLYSSGDVRVWYTSDDLLYNDSISLQHTIFVLMRRLDLL